MAGRRPKPLALKLVTGNPGKRPLRLDEPQGVPGWPQKPANLPKIASEEWDRLATLLQGEKRLVDADAPHLLGAAMAYASALATRKKLSGRGVPADLWLRLKTSERLQWDQYRKFLNDMCLSQGTRPRATAGRGRVRGVKAEPTRLESFLVQQHRRRAKEQARG